jgi:predicted GNAT superfamily acetyltransferase
LIIKPIDGFQDIKKVAEVEAATWGMKSGKTVPDHVLTAIARDGGVLLGAYEDDRLIGFTLGWLGIVDPGSLQPAVAQLKLVSHMTGVLSEYRNQRVGYQLKLAQRDWALSRGLDLITWTYDPLESRNGYFNIHLLGCICQTYLRNYYGEMSDQMNKGIPSDRLRVDWWISSPEVENFLEGNRDQLDIQLSIEDLEDDGYQLINPPEEQTQGYIAPDHQKIPLRSQLILLEIPADYQVVRGENPELALHWRFQTREIFESLFTSDYQIVDFIFKRLPYPRSFYLLERDHEN